MRIALGLALLVAAGCVAPEPAPAPSPPPATGPEVDLAPAPSPAPAPAPATPDPAIEAADALAADYLRFLADAPTERRAVAVLLNELGRAGARPLEEDPPRPAKPGDLLYRAWRGKALAIARVCALPLAEAGARVAVAALDSPAIELKPAAAFVRERFAFADTQAVGPIQPHQWLSVPLAIVGHVEVRAPHPDPLPGGEGTTCREVEVGRKEGDPVLVFADLLPHLAGTQRWEKATGEQLDALVASTDGAAPGRLLEAALGLDPGAASDPGFVAAELRLVPAFPPAPVGLDGAFIAAYAQGGRFAPFAAARALVARDATAPPPGRTAILLLVDGAELGAELNTSAGAPLLDRVLGLLLGRGASETALRRAKGRSEAVALVPDGGRAPGKGLVADASGIHAFARARLVAALTASGAEHSLDARRWGRLADILQNHGVDAGTVAFPVWDRGAPVELTARRDLAALHAFVTTWFYGETE